MAAAYRIPEGFLFNEAISSALRRYNNRSQQRYV
jgi:hypothetical protein